MLSAACSAGASSGKPAGRGGRLVQATNDKQQVEPMLEKIEALPEELGEVEHLLADQWLFQFLLHHLLHLAELV